ncbi:hypothetical protein KVV02_002174 [Mortierella alpina]|uniref:Thioredoxin domain-containing protein n=1 Tax=Mortierella alpina TaxID=64518 RepID=A0A9P8A4J9_MORAP|nr:hypothetical protein KVV02_002174 [Mortierella alpina]
MTVETPSNVHLLKQAYVSILMTPFSDKYEDTWEEDTYWTAVGTLKARSKELGFDDPFEVLKPAFFLESFEQIRESLMAGPPMFLRPGWTSPFIGAKVDVQAVVVPLTLVNGGKFSGDERVVVFDFWATWCGPCVEESSKFSDLAEKHAGRVAIVGINNESVFFKQEYDLEKVKTFIAKRSHDFRYTIYVDSPENQAKEALYAKAGYEAIPCVVLVVDGSVTYAGAPNESFEAFLQSGLKATAAKDV